MIRSTLPASKIAARSAPRNNGALRPMSGKVIKFGVDGRAAMLKGVDTLADTVQVRFSNVSRSENSFSNGVSYWIVLY
jgi:hypothetical protein